ncbi:MAG: glycosyltransferase family 4 protein [Desulfosoma sp.]
MHWASFDPFLIDDLFWQDKMGMPAANRQFLEAFFRYGRFKSCRFFCQDTIQTERMRRFLNDLTSPVESPARPRAIPQALAWDELRREPVDVMHHGDFTFYMPYVMEWRNRALDIAPFAVTGVTHSLDTLSIYTKCLSLLLACPKPYDAIICTSLCAQKMLSQTFDYLRERFKEAFQAVLPKAPRLVHIPLGIPDRQKPLVDKEEARLRLGWKLDEVVVLCLGRFSVRGKMDLSPFLEGCAWLFRKFSEKGLSRKYRLVLSGAGKKEAIRLVSELCRYVGIGSHVSIEANVSLERKELLYAASDVFCSLVDNYQETFGLTILEAMSYGLPVIASDFNGYRELVKPGVSGFLVRTYASAEAEPWEDLAGILDSSVLRYYRAQKVAFDMESFLEALSCLLTQEETRQSMGKAGQCEAGRYRWSVIVAEYGNLWQELAQAALRERNGSQPKDQVLPILTPHFRKIFGHYPTQTLREDTMFAVSPYGFDQLAEGFVPVVYGESSSFICKEVLSLIRRLDASKGYRLDDLVFMVKNSLGLSRQAALLHVDWLLKHGILGLKKN